MIHKGKRVGIAVCETRCNECLYSKQRIISKTGMQSVLKDVTKEDTFFVCHKHTLVNKTAMCRGFYDANPDCTPLVVARAMEHLHGEQFIYFVPADPA